MLGTNEATEADLKIIERLTQHFGWKQGDTLLYQQEEALSSKQPKMFEGRKSIKTDITLTNIYGNIDIKFF